MAGDGGVIYWSGGKSKMCTQDGKSEREVGSGCLSKRNKNGKAGWFAWPPQSQTGVFRCRQYG